MLRRTPRDPAPVRTGEPGNRVPDPRAWGRGPGCDRRHHPAGRPSPLRASRGPSFPSGGPAAARHELDRMAAPLGRTGVPVSLPDRDGLAPGDAERLTGTGQPDLRTGRRSARRAMLLCSMNHCAPAANVRISESKRISDGHPDRQPERPAPLDPVPGPVCARPRLSPGVALSGPLRSAKSAGSASGPRDRGAGALLVSYQVFLRIVWLSGSYSSSCRFPSRIACTARLTCSGNT